MIIQFIGGFIGTMIIAMQMPEGTDTKTWLFVILGCVIISTTSFIRGIQIGESK